MPARHAARIQCYLPSAAAASSQPLLPRHWYWCAGAGPLFRLVPRAGFAGGTCSSPVEQTAAPIGERGNREQPHSPLAGQHQQHNFLSRYGEGGKTSSSNFLSLVLPLPPCHAIVWNETAAGPREHQRRWMILPFPPLAAVITREHGGPLFGERQNWTTHRSTSSFTSYNKVRVVGELPIRHRFPTPRERDGLKEMVARSKMG